MGVSFLDFLEYLKTYLTALLAQQLSQYGMSYLGKSGNASLGCYASPSFGFSMPYPGIPNGSLVLPGSLMASATSPIRHNERNYRYSSGSKSSSGGAWKSKNEGDIEEHYGSSLLEEFKNNKNRCFEFSDIAGHIFEFRYLNYHFSP